MKSVYLELVMLFEGLHRLFLDVLKIEIDKLSLKDLSNVQAVILYNIGNNQLTVGEISNRGYYLGSNVSYNLKKMIESGYVLQKQSTNDKRSVYVSLSSKGKQVYKKIDDMLQAHVKSLPNNNLDEKDLKLLLEKSRRLETFWSHMLLHSMRSF